MLCVHYLHDGPNRGSKSKTQSGARGCDDEGISQLPRRQNVDDSPERIVLRPSNVSRQVRAALVKVMVCRAANDEREELDQRDVLLPMWFCDGRATCSLTKSLNDSKRNSESQFETQFGTWFRRSAGTRGYYPLVPRVTADISLHSQIQGAEQC